MLLGTPKAELWLTQFKDETDLQLARRLLSMVRLVTASELSREVGQALERLAAQERIGVFIEREIPKRWVILKRTVAQWLMSPSRRRIRDRTTSERVLLPVRMYAERRTLRGRGLPPKLRAEGAAKHIVAAPRSDRQEIGSEGALATIASGIARQVTNINMQPSAQRIRGQRISHFVVVTDFIGSGTRVLQVLESLWRVRSVRSWWSGKKIRLSVLAYSGTDEGEQRIRSHPSKPRVERLAPCPTVEGVFGPGERDAIRSLCNRYAPVGSTPLGYGNVGALIAFEHSCPNNAPAIFTESSGLRSRPWHALFPRRSTFEVFRQLTNLNRRDRDRLALETLSLANIAHRAAFLNSPEERRNLILVLGALLRGHTALDEIATTTLLQLPEIAAAIELGRHQGYLQGHLLAAPGKALMRELAQAPRARRASLGKPMYYPKSLRSPL